MIGASDLSNEEVAQLKRQFERVGEDGLAEQFNEELESRDEAIRRASEYTTLLKEAEEKGVDDEPEFRALRKRRDELVEESGAIELTPAERLAKDTGVTEYVAEQLSDTQARRVRESYEALSELDERDDAIPGNSNNRVANEMAERSREYHEEQLAEVAEAAGLAKASLAPAAAGESAATAATDETARLSKPDDQKSVFEKTAEHSPKRIRERAAEQRSQFSARLSAPTEEAAAEAEAYIRHNRPKEAREADFFADEEPSDPVIRETKAEVLRERASALESDGHTEEAELLEERAAEIEAEV